MLLSAYIKGNLWGQAGFKTHIIPITVEFHSSSTHSTTITFALATSVYPQPHPTTRKQAPPLSRGMWAQLTSPPASMHTTQTHLPLPSSEGCGWLILAARWRIWGGWNTRWDPGSGGPGQCVPKMNQWNSWFIFSHPSLIDPLLMTFKPTQQAIMTTPWPNDNTKDPDENSMTA